MIEEEPTGHKPTLETKRVFYDEEWKEIDDPSLAAYYRIGTVDSLGRFQGVVRDYYRSGAVQMKGKYLDGMKDGIFLYYTNRNILICRKVCEGRCGGEVGELSLEWNAGKRSVL